MDASPPKRPSPTPNDQGPPAKKIKTLPEEPAAYSDAVRKKLAAASRTGQACDRCKERKMKCDIDPRACQPCRQKGLRCYTTDRVTGQARERGESDRADNELLFLREQLTAYQHRYGPLQRAEKGAPLIATPTEPVAVPVANPVASVPDARYVGWPAPEHSEPLCSGPVRGTLVDILDGTVDVGDWDCEMMREYSKDIGNKFNLSRTSIVNTICGYQRIEDPQFPSREDGLRDATHFLVIMSQYVPIVHRPSFMELVYRFYDKPAALTTAERVQVTVAFAIIAHQTAVRNHTHSAEKFEDSHRYLHYALGHYRDLFHDQSLASMQAMALMIVHFRNLPKPGISWIYSHQVLLRLIELEYHRDPDRIRLPPSENDPLSKELRKRVFHSVLGICVTTGCRVGLPAPWQFQHIDLPLPQPIKDSEISKQGISPALSGHCEFWPCLHLAKLLPLLTELHNSITAVRKPAAEYLQTVEALNTKIVAWRQDWEESIKAEPRHVNLSVATLLMESWAAEYQLNLYHPVCCTSDDPDVIERHLEMCHKSAKRLLQSFHVLSSRYKGVDFTWHSTLAYATAFGITLHVYRRKVGSVTLEHFDAIRNELKGWVSLMAYADLVLKTGNHLQRQFQPRVSALEEEYRRLIVNPKVQSVQLPLVQANVLQQHKPDHPNFLQYQENKPLLDHRNSLPQPAMFQSSPRSQSQSQSPSVYQQPQQPWPPFAFLPQPQGPGPGQSPGLPSPIYPAFSQSPSVGPSMPTPIQTIPTSLASLLNEPHGMYMSYPTTPQSQNSLSTGDPLMAFSPNHYFDGPGGSMGWPLISMPPNAQ